LRSLATLFFVIAGSFGLASTGVAWSSKGHQRITAAAVESLANLEPRWMQAEAAAIVSASVQPDLSRPRELAQLRALEAPRHYLDLEVLEGQALPEEQWQYISLLSRMADAGDGRGLLRPDRDVTQVGILPYALVEATQRLAAIFAQLRVWPDDSDLRTMAAHQAGSVAHYAQDLCQPLHTTVHHDGRARKNGSSPQTGIHRQVDALIQSVSLPDKRTRDREPRVLKPLFPAIASALQESHTRVDRVYELANRLDRLQGTGVADTQLVEFARERYQQAVELTADLIHTAWMLSAAVRTPDWAQDAKMP